MLASGVSRSVPRTPISRDTSEGGDGEARDPAFDRGLLTALSLCFFGLEPLRDTFLHHNLVHSHNSHSLRNVWM
jgi:hypothetical protein